MSDLIEKARKFACKAHADVNHLYDGKSYDVHLQMAYDWGLKFIYLVKPEYREPVLAAIWDHDLCEDCRLTYNDVKNATTEYVADIVYACTNEKGKTRAERANRKFYADMIKVLYGPYVKMCDRFANVEYSKLKNSRMFAMYAKEDVKFRNYFKETLWDRFLITLKLKHSLDYLKPMFEEMDKLLKG